VSDLPLTAEERARAEKLVVFVVWYQDDFGDGDAFPISICLSESEAQADLARRIHEGSNKAFVAGWDGILIHGPEPLSPDGMFGCPLRTVREVLRRAARGQPGPVPVPFR
jgi:hypothetical protein